jgi:hypothetical protein
MSPLAIFVGVSRTDRRTHEAIIQAVRSNVHVNRSPVQREKVKKKGKRRKEKEEGEGACLS